MDWRRASNISNVGMFILTIILVVLAVGTLVLMVWVRIYPDPSQAPSVLGGLPMSGYGWGPPIFLGVVLLLTVLLHGTTTYFSRKRNRNAESGIEGDLAKRNLT
jgi:hypothetical protein